MRAFDRWKKVAVAGGLVAAMTVGAAAGVNAQSGGDGGNAGAPAAEPRAGATSPTESVFVPITPCRIVNTTIGSKIAANQTRAFESQGNTASQGGAASCGIPATASAIEVNMTGTFANGDGYLRVAPAGVPIPTATFLNYEAGFNASNAGTIALNPGTGTNFQVKAFVNATHLVVDVLGYYVTEAFAVVNGNGSLVRGNGVVSTASLGGRYNVFFDRNVTGCSYIATVGDPAAGTPPVAFAATALVAGTTNGVFVRITDAGGTLVAQPFHLTVDC